MTRKTRNKIGKVTETNLLNNMLGRDENNFSFDPVSKGSFKNHTNLEEIHLF